MCLYGHDKDIDTVKSHKRECNFICNRLATRLRANEWKQDNSSQSSSPGVHPLEFSSPSVSNRPPSFSRFLLYIIPSNTPHSSLSFLFPCCLPLHALTLFLSSATVSLFVTPTFSPPSPPLPLLPRSLTLWWIIHQPVYVINQHLFKRYDWGAAEVGDGRGDIDPSQRRTRRGGNWRTRDGAAEKGGRESNVTMEIWRREHSDGAWAEEKRARQGRKRSRKRETVVMKEKGVMGKTIQTTEWPAGLG